MISSSSRSSCILLVATTGVHSCSAWLPARDGDDLFPGWHPVAYMALGALMMAAIMVAGFVICRCRVEPKRVKPRLGRFDADDDFDLWKSFTAPANALGAIDSGSGGHPCPSQTP